MYRYVYCVFCAVICCVPRNIVSNVLLRGGGGTPFLGTLEDV